MSTNTFSIRLLCASLVLFGAVGCVETEADPALGGAGMSNAGGDTSSGGSTSPGGTGGTTGGGAGGAGGAPSSAAVYRCENPAAPKITTAGETPLIVDFDTGMFGAPTATGEPSADFMFTGGENGGTYTYQEPNTQIMRDVSLVEDRNGGQALSVVFTNATDYGGGMGLYFYPCLNATVYRGITLWARGSLPERTVAMATIPAGTVTIDLDVAEVAVDSRDSIGCAMNTPADMTLCTRPLTTFVVTDTWTQFTFEWADFDPGNSNGTPYIPTGDNLLGINLAMANAFGSSNDLELVIDDVAFLP